MDVRTKEEVQQLGRVSAPHYVNVPLHEVNSRGEMVVRPQAAWLADVQREVEVWRGKWKQPGGGAEELEQAALSLGCRSGRRSKNAAQILENSGILSDVVIYEDDGGFAEWVSAKLPTVR